MVLSDSEFVHGAVKVGCPSQQPSSIIAAAVGSSPSDFVDSESYPLMTSDNHSLPLVNISDYDSEDSEIASSLIWEHEVKSYLLL